MSRSLAQLQAARKGAQIQKENRAKEIERIIGQAMGEIKLPLSRETLALMGAALYWAEGAKSKTFTMTNSDPALILFFVRWVEAVFGIPPASLRVWMNIYEQQDENSLKRFWSDLTAIPISNFGKSYIKPKSTGFKKNNLYYGTIKVFVPKGTDIRHQVFGWVKGAMQNVANDVDFVQKKWHHLTEVERKNTRTHSSAGRAAPS